MTSRGDAVLWISFALIAIVVLRVYGPVFHAMLFDPNYASQQIPASGPVPSGAIWYPGPGGAGQLGGSVVSPGWPLPMSPAPGA